MVWPSLFHEVKMLIWPELKSSEGLGGPGRSMSEPHGKEIGHGGDTVMNALCYLSGVGQVFSCENGLLEREFAFLAYSFSAAVLQMYFFCIFCAVTQSRCPCQTLVPCYLDFPATRIVSHIPLFFISCPASGILL